MGVDVETDRADRQRKVSRRRLSRVVVVGGDRDLGGDCQNFDQDRGGERGEPGWAVHQRGAGPEVGSL